MKMDERDGRRRPPFRRMTRPGEVPGTVEADPEAPHPRIRVTAYSATDLIEEDVDEARLLASYLERWPRTWVNVEGLGDAGVLLAVADTFRIHRLALEDVIHVHQRPKVEEYEDHLFMVLRMLSPVDGRLETEQVSLFLGKNFLVTFQERDGDCLEPVRDRLRKKKGRIRQAGTDYLAYAVIDAVVDAWFPLLEDYGERLEDLEDRILETPDESPAAEIHRLKRDLLEVRRAVWPMREMVGALLREETFFERETLLYLRDCYDHVVQILDIVESHRDMASGLMELYLSSVSNRMNEVMKVLTVIATIFIPLTFIAGIYGMNFNPEASPWNMPELNFKYGYVATWVIMIVLAGMMLVLFRRRGWLGKTGRRGGRKGA